MYCNFLKFGFGIQQKETAMAASLIVNTLQKSVLNPDNIVKRKAVRNYANVKIDRISYLVTNNSYSNFFETFLLRNQPCILSSVNTEAWKSRKDWVNSDGKPNFEFLRKTFGTLSLSLSQIDSTPRIFVCVESNDI